MGERSVGTMSWHHSRPLVPTLAAALIVLALSGSAWFAVSLGENQLAELELQAHAQSHALILQGGIDGSVEKVAALRAVFQSSERAVSRGEFANFTAYLLRGQSAIVALSWLPRITREQREAHELEAARDGLPGYHISSIEPDSSLTVAPDKEEYFPVFYTSRVRSDSPIYGLDLNDGGLRQQTLERARDGDRMATSPSVRLRSVAGDWNVFIVALPVYAAGRPHETVQDRRRNLTGFVQGVFQAGPMIEGILASRTVPAGLDLYFLGADYGSSGRPLYFHSSRARAVSVTPSPQAEITASPHWSGKLRVGDALWTFIAVPISGGPGTPSHHLAWLVLAGGLFVVAYIWARGSHAHRLQAANAQLDAALSNMSQGLCMFDASGALVLHNDRYREMYGLPPELTKPGRSIRDLLEYRKRKGQFPDEPEEYIRNLHSALVRGKTFEQLVELSDGRTVSLVSRQLACGGWITTHEDITESRRTEAKLSHMALHDELTSLPNRRSFLEQLENRLVHLQRGHNLAVLCIDLDRFKGVNDTLGRMLGDRILGQIAARLQSCLRESDVLARTAGDEFAILQGELAEATDITPLAARLIETIAAPMDLDGHQVAVGASIGIAVAPTDAADADQLLKSADMALGRAKADGRGTYRFFEPKMDALMQARRVLMLDLRKALVDEEFELYYQPLVNLATNEITGFEALLRWNHPERGLVSPMEFISLAEETALIVPIGEWVLHQACREAARWPSRISIAINVSPAQFARSNVADAVTNALAKSGLAASRLELEITESVLLLNNDSTLATLHKLRKLGVRISMDDFGTGYSSLSYLRSFPFDKIKIDRSFIRDASTNEDSMAIIGAIIGLGASLRMTTTGEGVETKEQLDYLKQQGCVEAQGYFFGEPKPAAEVYRKLARRTIKTKSVA